MPSSTPLRSSPVHTLNLEIFSTAPLGILPCVFPLPTVTALYEYPLCKFHSKIPFPRTKILICVGAFPNSGKEKEALGSELGPHAALRAGVSVSLYKSQSVARQPPSAPLLIQSCSTNTKRHPYLFNLTFASPTLYWKAGPSRVCFLCTLRGSISSRIILFPTTGVVTSRHVGSGRG
jgi:hypothetical protein